MTSRLMPETVRQRLGDVSFEKRFYCADGTYLNNLTELAKALESMTDEMYSRYAAAPGNDFSVWVKEVVGDDKLARDLAKAKTQRQAAKAVTDRIAFLREKIPAA